MLLWSSFVLDITFLPMHESLQMCASVEEIYWESSKLRKLFEASYLQNFNAWWKSENIFGKKKHRKLFWYQNTRFWAMHSVLNEIAPQKCKKENLENLSLHWVIRMSNSRVSSFEECYQTLSVLKCEIVYAHTVLQQL